MKYAFIIGSNAFVVPSGRVCYSGPQGDIEFLRINSIYHDLPPGIAEPVLEIDLNICDMEGNPVRLVANKLVSGAGYTVKQERDNIQVLKQDGTPFIQVHQLDDETAMGLEHYLVAELEVNTPVAVIRITGDFKVGELNISAENEKLYVNDIGYGNSALAGNKQLEFTAEGVML
ncbi:MAG: hypothetical protein ACHQIM_13045 [Sphingobacteriales bacterium]